MIFNLLQVNPDPALQRDVCIVGAGAAGITLAVELARTGKSVLLLEGGGGELEAAAQDPYRSVISGRTHRGLHDGRFRALGGTTTKWGGQVLELDEIDFVARPWVEGSGWPFAKSVLRKYYERAATLEGVSGSLQGDADVWKRIGTDPPVFPDLEAYLSRWCPQPNFAVLHKREFEGPSIHVWLHANATRIMMDGGKVTGIRASTLDGRTTVFRAARYVFCMGAIECSRFFLQPRSGPLPWNASGLLGRHFQDHIDCNVGQFQPVSARALHHCFDSIFVDKFKYQPKVKLGAQQQRSAEVLNVAATLAFDGAMAETMSGIRSTAKHLLGGELRRVKRSDIVPMLRHSPTLARQAFRYLVTHRSFQPADSRISLRIHCEQEPCSASNITLTDEKDQLGLYRTRLCWTISSLELKTIRYFTGVAARSLAGLGRLVHDADLDDEALTNRCEDSFHHMGGMRMSAAPSQGVVDTDLKLHGVRNAYVCSSAVFPTSGFSNPTHTLLALAVRLADHLAA